MSYRQLVEKWVTLGRERWLVQLGKEVLFIELGGLLGGQDQECHYNETATC